VRKERVLSKAASNNASVIVCKILCAEFCIDPLAGLAEKV
jgi:hypothetical protein